MWQRIAIGQAMDIVGSVVRQLVGLEASAEPAGAPLCGGGAVRHVAFLASGRAAAETLEKAVSALA